MANVNPPVVVFTGGIIGGELHNRVDIPSYPGGAEEMENVRPKLTGPWTRRPPMLHIDPFDDHSRKGRLYEFVYAGNQAFTVRHTSDGFAFYLDDDRITIPQVVASLGAWSEQSTAPSSSSTISGTRWLDSNGAAPAVSRKVLTTSNAATLHVLAFEIQHGPLNLRIGETPGASNLMSYSRLAEGIHRLAFTPPSGAAYIEFWHDDNAGRAVKDSVSILAGPTLLLPTPYNEASVLALDYDQIKDILYLTHTDYWPRRLERRGNHSWSIVKHLPGDGPWGDLNTNNSVTITPSNTQGEITITASQPMFASTDVGCLFRLTGTGQVRTVTASAANVATGGIKVTGAGQGDSTAVAPNAPQSGNTNPANNGGWQSGDGASGGEGGGSPF